MPVTITVEDGTCVQGSNSYVDLEEARAYAEQYGKTLPADDDEAGAMLIAGAAYVNSYRDRFKGVQVCRPGLMAWPRYGAYLYEMPHEAPKPFPDDEIPPELIAAQCDAIIAVSDGIVLMPTYAGGDLPIIRERVGPLDTEYANPFEASGYTSWRKARVPAVDILLKPLLSVGSGLRSVRI